MPNLLAPLDALLLLCLRRHWLNPATCTLYRWRREALCWHVKYSAKGTSLSLGASRDNRLFDRSPRDIDGSIEVSRCSESA